MASQIQLRRDVAADWTSVNPTLASGELGIETDTAKFKIGDGSTAWTSLAYFTIPDASDTVKGKIELATIAETTTGSATDKAVTPDGLSGSDLGKRVITIKLVDDATALTIGDGKIIFPITPELNGYNLVDADAAVSTVSSSGTPTFQIRNVTDSVDMLSTKITVDATEYTSYSAATQPVIDTTKDDVATGDMIAIDKDVAGTGEKGDVIMLTFQAP